MDGDDQSPAQARMSALHVRGAYEKYSTSHSAVQ